MGLKPSAPAASSEAANPPSAEMFGGFDAAIPSPIRAFRWWPNTDARKEVDSWDLEILWRQARSLHANMPEVAMVVQTMVDLMGWLEPMPATADAEWNDLARRAFEDKCIDPSRFDLAGRMSWQSCQEWAEMRAIIDGDCLVVNSRAADGSARFAFYEAPQLHLSPEGKHTQPGVITNAATRVLYYVLAGEKKETYIPAYAAFLYSQKKDPARVRSVSELTAGINNSADLQDVQSFTKAGIKFSASYAVVERKDKDAIRAEMQSAYLEKTGSCPCPTSSGTASSLVSGPGLATRFDSQVVSLAPGRSLEVIHDNRPSNETSGFMDKLVSTLAYSLGLDPAVVFFPEKMGSAAARFTLKKMGRTIRRRLRQRAALMSAIWQHFISCEIATGNLRPCRDENWQRVRWIPLRDLTIDEGREIAGTINAVREGLADADRWTMSTEGKTQREILDARAENIRYAQELAHRLGVPLSTLLPGAVGSTSTPEESPTESPGEAG